MLPVSPQDDIIFTGSRIRTHILQTQNLFAYQLADTCISQMGIQGVEPRLSGYEPLVLTVIRYTHKAHRQGIEPQPSDLQSGALPLRYRWIILP